MRKFSIFLMALMMVMSATAANLTPIMDRGVKAEKPAQVAAFNPAARTKAVKNVSKKVAAAPAETIDLTFDNTSAPSFQYYAASGDWYLSWGDVTNTYIVCLDYFTSKEGKFGHYTIADLDPGYSYLNDYTSGSRVVVPYTDADFTISDEGNGAWSLSGYVVGEDGNTYNLNGYHEPMTIDLTFDNTIDCLFKYYASLELWYLGWIDVTGNNIVYLAYNAPKEGKFGHYTIADLDFDNSHLINNNVQVNYVDADFTIKDEGNGAWSLSGYVVGENGNTYNLNGYHEPKTIDVTFDNTTDYMFEYYASLGVWYLGWIDVTGNNIVYFAYNASEEGKFGHYTIANLDLDNSHLIYNNVQVDYVDADFTISDEGNGAWSLSGYVVGENGNTYNLNGYYEPKTLTFDNTSAPSFQYYAEYGLWYLGWGDVTNTYIIRLAYVVDFEGKFGHYTIADLNLGYSYLIDYSSGARVNVMYTDAEFTISDEGNGAWSLSGYVVCEDGNTYNLSGYYEPKTLTFDNTTDCLFKYYAYDGVWYLDWKDVTGNNIVNLAYIASKEDKFGHYTITDLDLDNSYLTNNNVRVNYVDADFTISDEGNGAWSLSGYVVCEDGNTYNLSGYYEPKLPIDVELTDLNWGEYLFDEKYWYINVLNSDYYFGLYLFSENGMFAGEYTGDNYRLYDCWINGLNGYESVTEYEIAIVSKAVAEPYEVPIAFELTGVVKTDKCNTYNLHFVVTGPIEPKEVVNANVECVDYEWPASEYPGVAGMFIFADTDVPSRAFHVAVAEPTGELFTVEDGIVKEYTGMVDYATQTPYMVDNGTVTVSLDMEKNILTVVAAIVCADSIQYNFTSEIPVEFDSSYTITYTANEKLEETKENWTPGLNINGFDAFVVGHTFSNGTGTITFSGEVTSIGETAFSECFGLTSITIPNSVTSIGDWAFYECSNLTSVVIPNSVMSIGGGAFYGCSGLTSIALPNSMMSIGEWAFGECSGLTSITCEAVTPPYCEDWCFNGVDHTIPVYVPEESVAAYKTAKEWEKFTHIQAQVFTLTLDADPSMGAAYGEGVYAKGREVQIFAIVNSGYEFIGWSDGNTENPRLLTLTCDSTITANFEEISVPQYTIDVTAENPALGTATATVLVLVEAVPYPGCTFVSWSDGNTENPRYIPLTDDIYLQAIFSGTPSGMAESAEKAQGSVRKVIVDGQLHIIRDDKTYTMQGVVVE